MLQSMLRSRHRDNLHVDGCRIGELGGKYPDKLDGSVDVVEAMY